MAVFFLLLTLVTAAIDFPAYWNQSVARASDLIGTDLSKVKLPETGYRLGLDLQGGTHLVYEADMSQIPEEDRHEALEGVRDVIERRVNAFGVSEPVVQTTTSGGTYRVIVELAGVLDVNQAIGEIGETPILEFKEENVVVDREATPEEQATIDAANVTERAAAEDVLVRARAGEDFGALIAEYGGGELGVVTTAHQAYGALAQSLIDHRVQTDGVTPIVVETEEGLNILRLAEKVETKRMELSHILLCWEGLPGCQNTFPQIDANIRATNLGTELTPENFAVKAREHSDDLATAGDGGYLGWVEPGQTVAPFEIAAMAIDVGGISSAVETTFGYHIIYKHAEEPVTGYRIERVLLPLTTLNDIADPDELWANTGLSGKNLKRSGVDFDPNTGVPYVTLQFDGEGADLFADLTERNVGKFIAIFLDGEAISVPQVNEPIYGGQAVITGDFALEEAKLLAQRLNAGALPVPIRLVSQQTVGPTLGAISLQKSVTAALIGFALVALFMIGMYRLPGFVAVFALLLYMLLNLAAYKLFGVTISLSGIAGFVLSMGMAVDANVLIFERMRDELRAGRDLRSATDEGFKRAWTAIRDGNLTTLIAAAVLYSFSSSFIKGFALTLSIGVILSMFTAITVTRAYLMAAQKVRPLRSQALYDWKRT
jgi:protein-export membrane protein SecD